MKHTTTVFDVIEDTKSGHLQVCVSCSVCKASFYWEKGYSLPRFCPFCAATADPATGWKGFKLNPSH